MRNFARLIKTLDSTNKTNLKVEALSNYFLKSSNEDMLWAIALMSHRRPKRPLTTTLLRQWASEESNLPQWLFEESYHIVGDLAETISLLITQDNSSVKISLTDCIKEIIFNHVLCKDLFGIFQNSSSSSLYGQLDIR